MLLNVMLEISYSKVIAFLPGVSICIVLVKVAWQMDLLLHIMVFFCLNSYLYLIVTCDCGEGNE